MSRKIVIAIMVISLMGSTMVQARLVSRSYQFYLHQKTNLTSEISLTTTRTLRHDHVESYDLASHERLIVAGRRERREIRRKIKRHFERQERRERRERRKAAIGGAIIGGIITSAIANKKREERRREMIERRPRRPHREYGY